MPLVRRPGGPAPGSPAPLDLKAGLASADEDQRWNAARAAADAPEHIAALAAALRVEPSARVREALLTTLAHIGSADSVAAVVPLLRSDDARLRAGASDALRLMMRARPGLLPPLLADTDVDVRILSCELARALPGPEATVLLGDLLQREQDANVCAAAVDVLAEVGQPDVLPILVTCAARFRESPFLAFAIQVTIDRIRAQPASTRG